MKSRLYTTLLFLCALLCGSTANVSAQNKREFRGAWIQCVNGQFMNMGTAEMQKTLSYQLDVLQKDGCNAIIFQVRPECDALYNSPYEPWSRFLTGQQGKAPSPYWDPLEWMVKECHKRGMEIHAWINPFRAKTKTTNDLSPNHVAVQYPRNVFSYDGQFILNPALEQNRKYICMVTSDIVRRYDVDGLHIDDYFYPYPVSGQVIDDDNDFRLNNNGIKNKDDWRRYNVDLFIQELHDSIHNAKPWVKFGVSPFGIYRNKKSDPNIGSETNGLQNYDQLYADILKWVNNGWIDYCVPQIYWEIGNKAADYETLIKWWDKYASNRPLFIGEDIERTVKYADLQNRSANQMDAKFKLHSQMKHVNGTVLWYAKAAVDNTGNYGDLLRTKYWNKPALQPLMPFIDGKAPAKPKQLKVLWTEDGPVLFWSAPKGKRWNDVAEKYVVYRFNKGERINLNSPSHIVTITSNTYFKLPYNGGIGKFTYVVTALDRLSNESKPAKVSVRL